MGVAPWERECPRGKSPSLKEVTGLVFAYEGSQVMINPDTWVFLVKCKRVLVSPANRGAPVGFWVGQALVALSGVLMLQANPSRRGCSMPTQGFPLRPLGMSVGHSFSTKPNLMISQLQLSLFAQAVCQNIQKS